MVHELVTDGIRNNTVSLKGVKGVAKDLEEVVMSPSHDEFYRNHMYANYGDIGEAVKGMLDEYSASHKIHESISSIGEYEQAKQTSERGDVYRHCSLNGVAAMTYQPSICRLWC